MLPGVSTALCHHLQLTMMAVAGCRRFISKLWRTTAVILLLRTTFDHGVSPFQAVPRVGRHLPLPRQKKPPLPPQAVRYCDRPSWFFRRFSSDKPQQQSLLLLSSKEAESSDSSSSLSSSFPILMPRLLSLIGSTTSILVSTFFCRTRVETRCLDDIEASQRKQKKRPIHGQIWENVVLIMAEHSGAVAVHEIYRVSIPELSSTSPAGVIVELLRNKDEWREGGKSAVAVFPNTLRSLTKS